MPDLLLLLHLAAAIVWLGGMSFMLLALRPAALAALEPQPRARLMAQVWRRFFALVWGAIAVLLATGGHLYMSPPVRPAGWHVMLGLGLLMFAIFGHLHFAGLRKFARAVETGEWPVAARAAAQMQKLVWLNFGLGWLAVAAVKLLR